MSTKKLYFELLHNINIYFLFLNLQYAMYTYLHTWLLCISYDKYLYDYTLYMNTIRAFHLNVLSNANEQNSKWPEKIVDRYIFKRK